jgi:cyclopropane-fatty-acyl-phospholipid synthase
MEVFIKTLLSNLNVTKREFKVLSNNFYKRLEKGGDLTLIIGEAYMAGEWRSKDLASFFRKVMTVENYNKHLFSMIITKPMTTIKFLGNIVLDDLLTQAVDILQNNQSIILSKRVGVQHYDIPDILYEYMLDPQRQYTCGYWKPGTKTLEEAQQNKMNLLIDKLQIPDNTVMNILDIGCGWGGLTNAISKRYPHCNVVGITISKEQIKFANDKYGTNKLKYIFCDYRDLPNKRIKYDRIISVGMFEQVGVKNFDTFFNCCESALTDEGIFVLHTITNPTQPTYITGSERNTMNKWIDKYIFPGSCIPTLDSMLPSSDSQGLMYHHIQNLSISYAKTLKEWYNNFKKNWDVIRKSDPVFFTKEFYNMWEFYLISCMVGFEKKQMGLSQIVFTKKMYKGMYIFTEKEIAI